MSKDVYIEPGLLKGDILHGAYFMKELDCWALQGASPKTNNIDDYEKMTQKEVLQMYPELKDLFDLKLEKNCFFRKGKNSGKWYDFH